MKDFTRLLLALSLLLIYSCAPQQKPEVVTEAEKEKLITALDQFNNAFQNGDTQTLGAMITEDYVHTNGSSKSIDKQIWLNYLTKRSANIASGSLEVTDYKMDQMEIVFKGSTAIVTGRVQVEQKMEGETKSNSYRVTHVWALETGKWKRAAFHDGKIE